MPDPVQLVNGVPGGFVGPLVLLVDGEPARASVVLWDLATGREAARFPVEGNVALRQRRIVQVGASQVVRSIALNGQVLSEVRVPPPGPLVFIYRVSFSPSGELVAVPSGDGLALVDLESGSVRLFPKAALVDDIRTPDGRASALMQPVPVGWRTDGRSVVVAGFGTADREGVVTVSVGGDVVRHNVSAFGVLSPDGRHWAELVEYAGYGDGGDYDGFARLRIVDLETGAVVATTPTLSCDHHYDYRTPQWLSDGSAVTVSAGGNPPQPSDWKDVRPCPQRTATAAGRVDVLWLDGRFTDGSSADATAPAPGSIRPGCIWTLPPHGRDIDLPVPVACSARRDEHGMVSVNGQTFEGMSNRMSIVGVVVP